MMRLILGLEYNGGCYAGWQAQRHAHSIQQTLEAALTNIAASPVTVCCAGRTDAGVHALGQIVHFDAQVERPHHCWLLGGNSQLPADIRILWIKVAADGFHARYSAVARCYRYLIDNRPVRSALLHAQTAWCYAPLDTQAMQIAAQALVGNHDFSSFRAQSCQSVSPHRRVYFIDVHRNDDQVIIEIAANAFLHHMVRNIVGVLMAIGLGKRPVTWTSDLLQAKNRTLAGMTAPPEGLFLAAVYYPEPFGLPKHPLFNKLPADAQRFD